MICTGKPNINSVWQIDRSIRQTKFQHHMSTWIKNTWNLCACTSLDFDERLWAIKLYKIGTLFIYVYGFISVENPLVLPQFPNGVAIEKFHSSLACLATSTNIAFAMVLLCWSRRFIKECLLRVSGDAFSCVISLGAVGPSERRSQKTKLKPVLLTSKLIRDQLSMFWSVFCCHVKRTNYITWVAVQKDVHNKVSTGLRGIPINLR